MRAATAGLLAAVGCAYVLPASWRAFEADPDDAPPAVTRALSSLNLQIAHFDQAKRTIVSGWIAAPRGVLRARERFVVSWERDPKEKLLTVYVRHEAQEQEQDADRGGAPRWGAVFHDSEREGQLLDRVEKELSQAGLSSAPANDVD